jgi:hypothetical protein
MTTPTRVLTLDPHQSARRMSAHGWSLSGGAYWEIEAGEYVLTLPDYGAVAYSPHIDISGWGDTTPNFYCGAQGRDTSNGGPYGSNRSTEAGLHRGSSYYRADGSPVGRVADGSQTGNGNARTFIGGGADEWAEEAGWDLPWDNPDDLPATIRLRYLSSTPWTAASYQVRRLWLGLTSDPAAGIVPADGRLLPFQPRHEKESI